MSGHPHKKPGRAYSKLDGTVTIKKNVKKGVGVTYRYTTVHIRKAKENARRER
jgi:hypothetical protein